MVILGLLTYSTRLNKELNCSFHTFPSEVLVQACISNRYSRMAAPSTGMKFGYEIELQVTIIAQPYLVTVAQNTRVQCESGYRVKVQGQFGYHLLSNWIIIKVLNSRLYHLAFCVRKQAIAGYSGL